MIDIRRSFTRTDVRVISAASAVVGAVGGYAVAAKRLKKKYETFAQEEIASIKRAYLMRAKEGPFSDPTSAAAVLIPEGEDAEGVEFSTVEDTASSEAATLSKELGYTENDQPSQRVDYRSFSQTDEERNGPAEEVTLNVFEDHAVDPDEAEAEEPSLFGPRDPEKPYIIQTEEFFEDRPEFSKVTITYYDGDDTLLDEREMPIDDANRVVGQDNLDAFSSGKVSAKDDPHTVYIRNEKMSTDFEIVKEKGKYTVMVLGMRESELVTDERIRPRGSRPRADD